jgi:hypothetical protein
MALRTVALLCICYNGEKVMPDSDQVSQNMVRQLAEKLVHIGYQAIEQRRIASFEVSIARFCQEKALAILGEHDLSPEHNRKLLAIVEQMIRLGCEKAIRSKQTLYSDIVQLAEGVSPPHEY